MFRSSVIVPDDASATFEKITSAEALWRWGIAVHMLYLVAAVAVDVVLYRLLKPGGATLAVVALTLGLLDVSIEAVNLLLLHLPLAFLGDGNALLTVTPQTRATASYIALIVFSTGFSVALLFFSGFCVAIGTLLRRTRQVPAVLSWLMIAAGACYFINSLTYTVTPTLSARLVPWILLPCLIGESSFAAWLAFRGRLGVERMGWPAETGDA